MGNARTEGDRRSEEKWQVNEDRRNLCGLFDCVHFIFVELSIVPPTFPTLKVIPFVAGNTTGFKHRRRMAFTAGRAAMADSASAFIHPRFGMRGIELRW